MNTAWFKYLPYEEHKHRKSFVRGNTEAWEVLTEVLLQRIESMKQHPEYSNPAWAFEQAHINGRKEMLQEIINMLNLEKE